MLEILYEDRDIIVVRKPAGMESQSAASFAPDMVSEIKRHIHNLYPKDGEPYVGVIHRLDKPVSGVMVYAKTQKAAAALSKQVQEHKMKKKYKAVVCGKPVDNVENFVDYLLKDRKTNMSKIVDKGIKGAKYAKLRFRSLETIVEEDRYLTLVEIELLTGRHHQIRVQFAGHGLPLWGDSRYNPQQAGETKEKAIPEGQRRGGAAGSREHIALAACELTFTHPVTQETMTFRAEPEDAIFRKFHPHNFEKNGCFADT